MSEALTQTEEKKIHSLLEAWSDDFAVKVVKNDFEQAEQYRNTNHEWRWRNADELYLAWTSQKYWEGTRVPRSSLGIYLTFEQIEAMLPRILSELFTEASWFEVAPQPGTDPAQARAVRDLMLSQGEQTNVREAVRRAVKSALIYGNGILELSWLFEQRPVRRAVPEFEPVTRNIVNPLSGEQMQIPTGEFRRLVRDVVVMETTNRPNVKYVPLKDFYIDPNTPSTNIQEARFVAVRTLRTVDELDRMREDSRFTIPPREKLLELANKKFSTNSDFIKGAAESKRHGWWNPIDDTSLDPGSKRIEVIAYWTKEKVVWLAGRETLLYSADNPFGFLPFYNCYYTDVLDRFYALAITDVLEGEQRLQESIINARIDELALSIHTPMVKKRGTTSQGYNMRIRPNQIWEAEDPAGDIKLQFPKNVTQQAFIEVQASENRSQKITGVTDLAVLGVPSGGGNSANRTATGVARQAEASASRIRYLVENVENGAIEPLLNDWHSLNVRYLHPSQVIEVMGSEAELIEIDPLQIIAARVKFSMRASARMRAKASLMQIFPIVSQTFLNPQFLSLMAQQQNQVVDINELTQLLLESFDYKPRASLFRPMTPEETEALNQPPASETIRMQMQQERLASQQQVSQEKNIVELVKTALKEIIKEKAGKE